MASPFGTCRLNKPAPAAFATNKTLLLSPPVVSLPRQMKMRPQRKCRFTVNAAKELHFNKDGSAIRKLQVNCLTSSLFKHLPLLLLLISCHFFFPLLTCQPLPDLVFFLRMGSISLQISLGLLLDQKDEM